ncbi:C45 family autoproteolytic acyltransferase/hydolase [Marinomonas algicola]|uniref:C45 family autoproteolytic acyltransferase/hydolase n=1 Tax=Marinomonas algicola TaxID=2773454 RepID=UPI00174D91D8|nr:C45 family peptidase [Marinomonas algicola]
MKSLHFSVINEAYPGEKFRNLFGKNWPAYRAWYLDEGEAIRPSYLDCIQAFKHHMPELYPLYRDIVKLVDGDDLQARFLTLYCPPPFFSGCSQLTSNTQTPILIRNYDFPPILCEGVVSCSQWLGKKVVAMADCVWGALDGMNESGLAVSIAYGGRLVKGEGFGVTIVIRYILETCATVEEAIAVFQRIPIHLDYNIALIDASGHQVTVYIAPDREVVVTQEQASTNHQDPIVPGQALFLADTGIRLDALNHLVLMDRDPTQDISSRFLYPPLYRPHANHNSGTLYTAVYYPSQGQIRYLWPTAQININFMDLSAATEQEITIFYDN